MTDQEYIQIECSPADPASLPWRQTCTVCKTFRQDPRQGSFVWVLAVASHFKAAHGTVLVGTAE